MIVFPNAKINLGLYVTAKRRDGYHNIQTLMYPIPLCDALEMMVSPDGKNHFHTSGIHVGSDHTDNLCFKAWLMMQNEYSLPSVIIHLHKAIPAGAGLGGGSADAAFTIKLANALFRLGISTEKMQQIAARLGMDCPFFILNKPAIAVDRGDWFLPSVFSLQGKYLFVVKPHFHIPTKAAYASIKPVIPPISIEEILKLPVDDWKRLLKNDFEPYVYSQFPEAKTIVPLLYAAGAEYASMSGSGSAFFGIFNSEVKPDWLFGDWFCRSFYLPDPKEIPTLP